ncbi:hypothetical protein V5O48_018155 [Marasmius crinis-equi]|uniref:Uncharacterized protein n=1 Tax=Marasmius crinis-equi TaxID=585013 RepID=A0ABR3ELZ2_9AGAR
MNLFSLTIFACLISLVYAQTATTTNANGQSVVVVVSTNQGRPVTQTVSTIAPPPTPQQGQQGPVGQPAATGTPFAPIPYQYTTVVNGQTSVLQDVFTPSLGFPHTTVLPQVPSTGTILDYSSWLSQYGATNTNAAAIPLRMPSNGWTIISMLVASTMVCWMSGLLLLFS